MLFTIIYQINWQVQVENNIEGENDNHVST